MRRTELVVLDKHLPRTMDYKWMMVWRWSSPKGKEELTQLLIRRVKQHGNLEHSCRSVYLSLCLFTREHRCTVKVFALRSVKHQVSESYRHILSI